MVQVNLMEALASHRKTEKVVSVRMRPEEIGWVRKVAAINSCSMSEVIRAAIRQAQFAEQEVPA